MSKEPSGLPPVRGRSDKKPLFHRKEVVTCPKCGQKGRVVSNSLGVNVHCVKCKTHWPISSTPMVPVVPPTPPRGITKTVLVEPNWDIALENDGDVANEQVGPKKR